VRLAPAGRARPVRLPTRPAVFDRRRWPTVSRCCLVRLQLGPPPGTPLGRPADTRAPRSVQRMCGGSPTTLPEPVPNGRPSRIKARLPDQPRTIRRPASCPVPASPPPPFSDTDTRRHPAEPGGRVEEGRSRSCMPSPTAPRLARHRDQDALATPKRPRDLERDPRVRRRANGDRVAPASARPTTLSSSGATRRSLSPARSSATRDSACSTPANPDCRVGRAGSGSTRSLASPSISAAGRPFRSSDARLARCPQPRERENATCSPGSTRATAIRRGSAYATR
jgi:hypothetical protein